MRSGVGPRHARRPIPTLLRGIYLPRSMDAGAFAMTTYGIPLLVLATTESAALTGLAFALEWMPRLMAFALAGAMVDRYGTTRVFRLHPSAHHPRPARLLRLTFTHPPRHPLAFLEPSDAHAPRC